MAYPQPNYSDNDDEYVPWISALEPEHVARLEQVERDRESGKFSSQEEYDEAHWEAEGMTPPGMRDIVVAQRSRLGSLIPLALDYEPLTSESSPRSRLDRLVKLSQKWTVKPVLDSPGGLCVISVAHHSQREREMRDQGWPVEPPSGVPYWSGRHPLVLALLKGFVDGAITVPRLGKQRIDLAPTRRTLNWLRTHPGALSGFLSIELACLRAESETEIAQLESDLHFDLSDVMLGGWPRFQSEGVQRFQYEGFLRAMRHGGPPEVKPSIDEGPLELALMTDEEYAEYFLRESQRVWDLNAERYLGRLDWE